MNTIYVIIAYRWNDSERHSYLVGSHFDLEKAKEIAEKEADCRGGNTPSVFTSAALAANGAKRWNSPSWCIRLWGRL